METRVVAPIHALTTASRRALLALLGGGLLLPHLPGLGNNETAAKRNGHRRQGKRRTKRKKRRGRNRQAPALAPPEPVTRIDAACVSTGAGVFSVAAENNRMAQTFTAFASGSLVRADVNIAKLVGEGGDFVLRLSPVKPSGEVLVPTNDVLAETAVAAAIVPGGASIVQFGFANPFPVVAGTSYALVLTRPGGGTFAWLSSTTDVCAGDASASADQTGAFVDAGGDFFFTIFVRS
jgi:hypothetical protein